MQQSNPFFSVSLKPYQAPPFDEIRDEHYRPAFDEAVRIKRQEIADIAACQEAPSFDNTYLALELSGKMLNRVTSVFFAMTSAHTNDYLQELDEAFSAELAALADEIYLNPVLFSRLDTVWQQRHAMAPDAEALRLIEVIWQNFMLAGATLSPEQKTELKAINQSLARLVSQFNQHLLAADKTGGLETDDVSQLAGLSEADIQAAAQAAADKGLDGHWWLALLNTTQQPALQSLENRAVREALFKAGWHRTEKGDANDTRAIVTRLAMLRAEKAALLGFDDYASWSIASQMAKTPDAALGFMRAIVPAATARARQELADIQACIDKQQGRSAEDSAPAPGTGLFMPNRSGVRSTLWMKTNCGPILHSIGCWKTACSGPPASCSALSLCRVMILRCITLTCGFGKFLTAMARGWRCSMAISLPATAKAAAHGWAILLSSPRYSATGR